MLITINGEKRELEKQLNLSEMLERFDLPRERVAVELNREVVRKRDWENIFIKDSDQIEVIHFVGGG